MCFRPSVIIGEKTYTEVIVCSKCGWPITFGVKEGKCSKCGQPFLEEDKLKLNPEISSITI